MICPIKQQADANPNALALQGDGFSFTYCELDREVDKTAASLYQVGIQAGKVVPFLGTNHPNTALLLFALFRLGAIAYPHNFRIPQTSTMIDPANFSIGHSTFYPCSWDRMKPSIYLQTSGSTGEPKIAALSLMNFFCHCNNILSPIQLEKGDCYLVTLPFHHIAGLAILFRCFSIGATACFSETGNITHLSLVPTQLIRLLQKKIFPYPALKTLLLGGAPLPTDLITGAKQRNIPLLSSYGMTEMTSTITVEKTPLPHIEWKIEVGEILVKGPSLFLGYVKQNELFLHHGWFPTGDLGKTSADGSLEIIGRKDRQFICAGENIHPQVIEKALCQIHGIHAAYVTSIPDKEYGARPIAYVKSHAPFDEKQIKKQLKLPSLFIPVRIVRKKDF